MKYKKIEANVLLIIVLRKINVFVLIAYPIKINKMNA